MALHGDGLTSLQYRPAAAAATLETKQEAKSDLTGPVRIRIERRGNNFKTSQDGEVHEFTC